LLLATVIEKAVVAGEGTGDLISVMRGWVRLGDRAGADDLVFRKRVVFKARERRVTLGAGETEAAITLGVRSI
jgi:hypothetical protein